MNVANVAAQAERLFSALTARGVSVDQARACAALFDSEAEVRDGS